MTDGANDGTTDPARALLRLTVATLWYRAEKTLRGAPADFAAFRVGPTSRTPGEILAHLGDLIDWAIAMAHASVGSRARKTNRSNAGWRT